MKKELRIGSEPLMNLCLEYVKLDINEQIICHRLKECMYVEFKNTREDIIKWMRYIKNIRDLLQFTEKLINDNMKYHNDEYKNYYKKVIRIIKKMDTFYVEYDHVSEDVLLSLEKEFRQENYMNDEEIKNYHEYLHRYFL